MARGNIKQCLHLSQGQYMPLCCLLDQAQSILLKPPTPLATILGIAKEPLKVDRTSIARDIASVGEARDDVH